MRILLATSSHGRKVGGASAVLVELGSHLEALGHQVEILYGDDLPPGRIFANRLSELYFSIGVARHILRNPDRYDVVNLRAPVGAVYGILRRLKGRSGCPPYIAEMDGLEERRPVVQRNEHRKNSSWDYRWKNRVWHRAYHLPRFQQSARTADWVICANRETWNYILTVYKLAPEHVTYLPHGVNKRFFRERDYPALFAPKLLFAGTWLPQRGIKYIAEAMTALVEKFPGIRLTIAGVQVPAEAVLPTFPAHVRASIDVIPLVDASEMPDLYAQHDMLLFPSFFEGVPLVVLEAMAGGMPVITAETSGMVDLIRDDWNGRLIPAGDTQAIVSTVTELTNSPETRARLGTTARETAAWFSWDRAAATFDKILRRLVPERA